jgi:uncharacterized protein (TIGR01777 family)
MKLFITGATGLIGRRLVIDRLERSDQVVLLSRDAARAGVMFAATANRNITVVQGDPAKAALWQRFVDGCDAVINLAGAGIADQRWTAAHKKTIVSSRVDGTQNIVSAIAQSKLKPRVLINGSATGYYGDTGDTPTDEGAPAGRDFLAELCVAWEGQALRASELGVRVVLLRTSMVLDDRGGALAKLMTPFRFFLGGPLGSGRQYMPWIHWRDEVGLMDLALENANVAGALNGAAPEPVTNRELSRVLGNVIGRPSWLPVPKMALRIVAGEIAASLLMSQRIIPAKAQHHGYRFLFPSLERALESLLGADRDEVESIARPGRNAIASASVRAGSPQAGIVDVLAARDGSSREAMPQAPIKLLAISVDGTLLRSDGSISQGVVQACRNAQRAGCVVVLATARPPRGLRAIWQALDILGPTINYNGAVIWNPQENQPQYHEPLAPDVARSIVTEARAVQPAIVVGIEALDHWYTDPVDPRVDRRFEHKAIRLFEPDEVGAIDKRLTEPVTRLNLMGLPGELQEVLAMLREKYWRRRMVAIPFTDPHVIQIVHPLAEKAIALQRIAHHMNLPRDQVMAIGDGPNDLGMLEWAGFSVAVANATISARELADAVVPSNDDQGVARAIGRYVLARR